GRSQSSRAIRAEQTKRWPLSVRASRQRPEAMPYMMSALGFSLAKPRQIVIAGPPGADDTRSLLRLVWQRYIPNRVLLLADGAEGQKQLARWVPSLASV